MSVAAWEPVAESGEAEKGVLYRTTYFLAGPFPNEVVRYALGEAIKATARASGKMSVSEVFVHDRDVVARFIHDAPRNTWAIVVRWEKTSDSTPLLFFMGPAGIITLAIVGVVVAVIGIVIVSRRVEKTLKAVPEILSPGVVLGAVFVLGLLLTRFKKG